MTARLSLSGVANRKFELDLIKACEESHVRSVGLAVAYVSSYGVSVVRQLATKLRLRELRLIADIGDAITHPDALRLALNEKWLVRGAAPPNGTFHPKFILGGQLFDTNGLLSGVRFYAAGSANLSRGGLQRNVECSFIRTNDADLPVAGKVFQDLWTSGWDLTYEKIDDYEKVFAERNRNRSPKDMETLGVTDVGIMAASPSELRKKTGPKTRLISNRYAAAAWAGLESFTGEYRFQLEFPRDAGQVLKRILSKYGKAAKVMMVCDDGFEREMSYRFYEDNSMFRLNIPPDAPGIVWARENRAGIAIVEDRGEGSPILHFSVVKPGRDLDRIVQRSSALGTWGATSTRLYGWY